ncbi:thioredoxin family protein [Candidatus Bathyarchaeota archaeon]|nr:thioredoxin family protein [Candidatus Bathyarchaeota archaeon]
MKINLTEIEKRTVSVNQYINSLEQPFRQKFLTRKQTYQLKQEIITQLKKLANKYVIVAFSAEWCKDCTANIPVLALISEATGIDVRIFGGLKKDPLNMEKKWRIPPSPPEVKTFQVNNIPLILLFDREGNEIGRIIENPQEPTLEEELLKVILTKRQ